MKFNTELIFKVLYMLIFYTLLRLKFSISFFQGINGILADEMGLGKTVQSIALLAHLAEVGRFFAF